MAIMRGQDGALKLNSADTTPQAATYTDMSGQQTVGQLSNWTLTVTNNTQETTEFGDDWQEFARTTLSFSARASGYFEPDDATMGQDELMEALITDFTGDRAGSGDQEGILQAQFFVDDASATNLKGGFFGNVLVESADISAAVGDLIRVDYSLRGAGQLKYSSVLT